MIAAMRLVAGMMLAALCVFAQTQPAFEVASVKITPAADIGYFSMTPYGKGRFKMSNATLELLICIAYGVEDSQIVDAPGWLSSQRYEVDARPEDGVSLSQEEVKPRLQKLLVERFKLATHTQMHEVAGYALVVAKGGPKLKPASSDEKTGGFMTPNRLWNPNADMEMLAAMLARPVHRPVIDQTAIQGSFDIDLSYAPEGSTDSPLPSIFTALQEKMGLRLENHKVPQQTLVIEHVERVPAGN